MASYTISPIWGAGAQLFDNSGNVLTGGKIYTYAAGTTTPAETYTTPLGNVANSNPIVANAAGRLTNEIWLPVSGAYKFVLKDSNDVLIATYDNIPTIAPPPVVNDASSVYYESGYEVTAGGFTVGQTYLITSVGSTNFVAIGAAGNVTGIHFTATGVGSGTGTAEFSRTVQTKLRETISVTDFGAAGDGTTEDAAAFIAAIAALPNGGVVYVPPGEYKISSTVSLDDNVTILGAGTASVILGNCSSDNSDSVNGLFAAKFKSNIALDSLKIIPFNGVGGIRSKFILCNNVQIKNCYLDGELSSGNISSYPIWIAGCSTASVINHISYNFRDHVYIAKSNWGSGTTCGQVDVIDSHFENVNTGTTHAYPTGVYVYHCEYTNVTGCTFKNITPSLAGPGYAGYGVYEGDGTAIEVNVKNCNFYLTLSPVAQTFGCIATQADLFSVIGCTFLGTSSYSFNSGVSYGGKSTVINDNLFRYAGVPIFMLETSGVTGYRNLVINGNSIDNSTIGIRISVANWDIQNVNVSNNVIKNCTQSGILFNVVGDYNVVCNNNLIENVNTSNGSTEPFESGINFFGSTPTGVVSGNFVINDLGVGYARYGVNIAATNYPLNVSNSNSFSGMISGGVRNHQAIPTTGSWVNGDTRWTWNATSGQPMGWVCTVSGTPGTWAAMPNLT